ncbi:ABC transporter ATP-binding protein [Paraburkholderia sp. MM5482-R1]|uniref:ABC transporter ATP-binding protein n=1 Tax=unclassified Paraburkholderia TaxID=2615204 RepID=UPI003D1FD5F0
MPMLLDVNQLAARYGSTSVLHGVDLQVDNGEICALLGANGAGKTTTLRALCQLMVKTEGTVTFGGQRIDGFTTERIARAGVAHVPDGRGTFLGLTTEENLLLGASSRGGARAIASDIERMYGYFPRLRERRKQQAGTLSGGEQQMLAIGRALMGRPKLLMLDEPSFGLAPLVVQDIFSIMRRINREEGMAILLIEQNANIALDLAHRAYLIEQGRIVMSGKADDMRKNARIRQAYLGD